MNYLVIRVQAIQLHALGYGLFLRGSIVEGEVFTDDNFILGKGIIDAYKLEHSHAKYPRIVISSELISNLVEEVQVAYYSGWLSEDDVLPFEAEVVKAATDITTNNFHYFLSDLANDDERCKYFAYYRKSPNISLDNDGQYFVDSLQYLKLAYFLENSPQSNKICDYIMSYGGALLVKLKNHKMSARIYEKYYWCFNQLIEFSKSLLDCPFLDDDEKHELRIVGETLSSVLKRLEQNEI